MGSNRKKIPNHLKFQIAAFAIVALVFTGWIGPSLSQQNDNISLILLVVGVVSISLWGLSLVQIFLEIFSDKQD